jgi:phosphocarrier protein HPr
MTSTLSRKMKIINKLGLHARASAKFVNTANRYSCELQVIRGNKQVNGKSIMGIMMLAASQGTELEIKAYGEHAEEALKAIEDLIHDRFGENE